MTARDASARRRRARSAPAGAAASPARAPVPLRWQLRRGALVAGLCLGAALLWQTAFAPLDAWPVAYVMLVPWGVGVVAAARRRTALLWAWLSGLLLWLVGMHYLVWITPAGYAALAFYMSLYWLLAGAILRGAMRRGWPAWVVLPVLWVALEYARAWIISGFPWFLLAHSQYRRIHLIQVADLTGAYGLSFFVALVNAVVLDLLLRPWRLADGRRPWRRAFAGPAVAAGVLAALLGYGALRLGQQTTRPGPRIALVQAAFPVSLTNSRATDEEVFHTYLAQTDTLAGQELDLLVWPESMLPGALDRPWHRENPEDYRDPAFIRQQQRMQADLAERLGRMDVPLLGGGATYRRVHLPPEEPGMGLFNSAMLFRAVPAARNAASLADAPAAGGRGGGWHLEMLGRYDKRHLVPFSEYVPFRQGWPALHRTLRWFVPEVMPQLVPGAGPERFEVLTARGSWTVTPPICYEGVFARVVRPMVYQDGRKRADVVVNVSNDGWFIRQDERGLRASFELEQHLVSYVFRAVENRVPVVRAVNCGISGFIGSDGRIEQVLRDQQGRAALGVGTSIRQVRLDGRSSVYGRWGDVFAQLCALGAGLMAAALWWRGRPAGESAEKDTKR